MILLAIDPGSTRSAYCLYDTEEKKPFHFETLLNCGLILNGPKIEQVVIEKVACYGMPVGETIFETVFWTGRFAERYLQADIPVDRMTRKEVVTHICGSAKAKDSNIIQALKDRFGEKGTKKNPGVLYGIKADEWQALALAVAYAESTNLA
jgi:hypothetical protein